MRVRQAVLVVICAVCGLSTGIETATPLQSAPDRIYTEAQAERGAWLYRAACEECHAPDLSGGKVVPGLAGPAFVDTWRGASVRQLLERIVASMPEDDPLRLDVGEKADIVAFILRANGWPPGDRELPDRLEMLETHALDAGDGPREDGVREK